MSWIEKKSVVATPKTGAIASISNMTMADRLVLPEFNIKARVLIPSQKSWAITATATKKPKLNCTWKLTPIATPSKRA